VIQFELASDPSLFEEALEFAQSQVRNLIERYPRFYPMYTQNGIWKHEGDVWSNWCDGFLPGMMWLFQRHLGPGNPDADWWMDQAIAYTRPLEPRKMDSEVHDLGFLFLPTYLRWYSITKDHALNEILVQAGQTLALNYQEKGQYLHSFVSDDSLFIDIMMNVGIVYYAARETGDRLLRDIAQRHSLTTRRVLVRGDGSTAQEGLFNVESGEFLRQSTHQGYRGDSCWSRGLAWSLYGFSTSYEYSRDPRFLETAQSCADYYITHSPSDGIAPWDFNAPSDSRKMVDTSAAAITAAGLLRLCRMVPDPMKGHFYWTTAIRILRSLCENHLAKNDPGWEGVLKGGVYHVHNNLGVNESVMWGDYYFVEALESAIRQLP
jgi:unsaturated chondroitin disaccharide hydrolase